MQCATTTRIKHHLGTRGCRRRVVLGKQRQETPHVALPVRTTMTGRRAYNDDDLKLLPPSVIYQDNHLLVVNKPAGWHSVPKNNNHCSKRTEKCLLTYGKAQGWGGGSRNDFLLPLHRLDQPCTGLQMYGKTSKAASRIQSQWKLVQKTYLCVLDGGMADLNALVARSSLCVIHDNDAYHRMEGYLQTSGRTVKVRHHSPWPSSPNASPCSLEWKWVDTTAMSTTTTEQQHQGPSPLLVAVRTRQGRRHMIRALLASHGAPLAGDLRYGAARALPDQSVALHAAQLQLPVKLQLGSVPPGQVFTANVPWQWHKWFGIGSSIFQEEGEAGAGLQIPNK